jgi:hypothetical protein
MSNTKTDHNIERDFDGTFPGSSNSDHAPRPPKAKKLPTGTYGLKAANRIDAAENQAVIDRAKEMGSGPEEARLASKEALHAIRVEKLGLQNGHTAVDTQIEIEPVPELPPVEVGEQAKLFE